MRASRGRKVVCNTEISLEKIVLIIEIGNLTREQTIETRSSKSHESINFDQTSSVYLFDIGSEYSEQI